MKLTFDDAQVRRQHRLVQALAADLERIRLGIGPSSAELALAPRIDDWRPCVRAEPALTGLISGHPSASGLSVTSGLYVLDPDRGFARTFSRFYLLGDRN